MEKHTLQCGRYQLSLDRPLIMGVLNLTPDSFSDGGRFTQVEEAVHYAESMVRSGAALLDIGGESTRPNALPVSPDEEMERVLPVLAHLQTLGVPLSLDTRRTCVMRAALSIGVDLINDVSALEDEGAVQLLAQAPVAVCLVHKQGNPDTMQLSPSYKDVVSEVMAYLADRIMTCERAGIHKERLLVDPGFGFGKTLSHNLTLLQRLSCFQQLAVPLLVGLSRKSMLGAITGESIPAERVGASVAAALEAVRQGARIIRVHDVKETRQAIQVWEALQQNTL